MLCWSLHMLERGIKQGSHYPGRSVYQQVTSRADFQDHSSHSAHTFWKVDFEDGLFQVFQGSLLTGNRHGHVREYCVYIWDLKGKFILKHTIWGTQIEHIQACRSSPRGLTPLSLHSSTNPRRMCTWNSNLPLALLGVCVRACLWVSEWMRQFIGFHSFDPFILLVVHVVLICSPFSSLCWFVDCSFLIIKFCQGYLKSSNAFRIQT